MDDLLARLEVDSPHIARRIVTLLMDALTPSGQSKSGM